jgi:hypothetical protein
MKSSCNKDMFVFIPEMEDKRICPWQAICKLREYNKIIYDKNVIMSSYTSIEPPFLFMDSDTCGLLTLRFLIILIKKELDKMGIDTKKFTVYSIKHSA